MSHLQIACATAIGAGALVYAATSSKRSTIETSLCASARRTETEKTTHTNEGAHFAGPADAVPMEGGVSARMSTSESSDLSDGFVWSEEAEEHFSNHAQTVPPKPTSEKVKQALIDLKPKQVDSRRTGTIGVTVLSCGRAEETTKKPPVTGALMFNIPDVYADELDAMEEKKAMVTTE